MTCPVCTYLTAQNERLMNENLRLRLEQADGPRLRVNELERIVETLNTRIAGMNRSKK